MFDISFSELIVIAVVALLVIGPEKLPKVARTLGALTGRMQKYVAQIKDEVNREVRFQELQQLQQEIQSASTNTKEAIQSTFQGVKEQFSEEVDNFQLTPPDLAPPVKPVSRGPKKSAQSNSAQSSQVLTKSVELKSDKPQSEQPLMKVAKNKSSSKKSTNKARVAKEV